MNWGGGGGGGGRCAQNLQKWEDVHKVGGYA